MSKRKRVAPDEVRHVEAPVIVARGLSRWYGQVAGVNDVTVEIGRGVTGLLGPNGAGKSTLMRLLVGQLAPSRGELTVLGEPIATSPHVLRKIGYCPEHESSYDDLTGLELVTFLTELHGFPETEARSRAEAALARMELTDAQHRLVGEYSKGMRQRAKLAQALAHDPEVIFLDEPLNGCDPLARARIVALIKELGQAGKCVVVSSHVLPEVEAMTSEILLIHKGRILAEGDVYALREMIDAHPHRIRVACDQPRKLAQALVGDASVVSAEIEADAVTVETRAPDACYPAIPRLAKGAGVRIDALVSPDNNLESVFRYLTEGKPPEAGLS